MPTKIELERELLKIREAELIHKARGSLLAFTLFSKPDYNVNWHHRRICNALDAVASRQLKRLLIMMPPRHGKTELGSRRYPAYVLGRDPDRAIIAASYADSLAARNNRDVQRIMDSRKYAQVFPHSKLSGSNVRTAAQGTWLRNSDMFEIVEKRGSYRSAGIGSGITGMGADDLIIDDPIKNWKEALSSTRRNDIWEWYTSTAFTRLEKGGSIIVIMTQWHEDDLSGRIMSGMNEEDDEPWTVLKLEALKESVTQGDPRQPGDALWPWKYDVKSLHAIKKQVGPRIWNSLYQQDPVGESGNVWLAEWWKEWRELPRFEEKIISADLRFKDHRDSGSWVVFQAWGRKGEDYYLLDQVRGRWGYSETEEGFLRFATKHKDAREKLVENKANGAALESRLKTKIPGIKLVEPDGSKPVRAMACEHVLASGRTWIPADRQANPWVEGFVRECSAFTTSMSHKEDDQVDTASQAILWFERKNTASQAIRKLIRM